MYFQPSLTTSTPTRSTDPLAIRVKKGEIIFRGQQHLRGSASLAVCLWTTVLLGIEQSCLLGMDDSHGRIEVGSIFSSPSRVKIKKSNSIRF